MRSARIPFTRVWHLRGELVERMIDRPGAASVPGRPLLIDTVRRGASRATVGS
jgi:hypothetical protein